MGLNITESGSCMLALLQSLHTAMCRLMEIHKLSKPNVSKPNWTLACLMTPKDS